jgi:exonuclease SbcD
MALRFMHVDDVHIGRERLEGALPSSDFAAAFNQAVDVAIEKQVAFLLVAGDFFDKARIEPNHLAEGEAGLFRLKSAGIPVVAIEGNHDVVSSYDDRPSWLTYLNTAGLLRLLRTEFKEGQPLMKEWTDADRVGNWLDVAGARIYGAGWFGASTARRLELLAPHLEKSGFTILMLHAGVNGMAEEFGMIDRSQLDVVREKVDYAALGHMHRSYVVDGWAHNAGALENWDLGEVRYGDEKGYWLVDVHDDGTFIATKGCVKRRPVHVAKFDCDDIKTLEELRIGVVALAAGWKLDPPAVICLKLTGLPSFNTAEIDRKALEAAVVEVTRCAAAEVSPAFGRGVAAGEAEGDIPPREAIEAEEIAKLIAETGRYEGKEDVVASLIRSVLAVRGDEELYGELSGQAGPLLGDVDEAH